MCVAGHWSCESVQVDDPQPDADDSLVSADDVAALNRASVDRSAAIARLIGSGLVVIGVVVTLGWVWVAVRTQQQLDDTSLDVEFKHRLDTFAANLSILAVAALTVGVGAAMRLIADYSQTTVGSSVTGWVEGDRFPDDEAEAPSS
jgi:hypothetical protein